MNYRQFVKEKYSEAPSHLSAKEKIKYLASLWSEFKRVNPTPTESKKQKVNKAVEKVKDDISTSEHLGSLGLEMKKRGRKPKNLIQNETSEELDDIPIEDQKRHYKNMLDFEKKNQKGKLSEDDYGKLKRMHFLHGAGFFDKAVDFASNNKDLLETVGKELLKHAPGAISSVKTLIQGMRNKKK